MRPVRINAPQAMPGRAPDPVVLHVLEATDLSGAKWRMTEQACAWRAAWITDRLVRSPAVAQAVADIARRILGSRFLG